MLDIFIISIVVIAGFNIKSFFRHELSAKDNKYLNVLWLYHLLFGLLYFAYVKYGPGGDAYNYWMYPKTISFPEAYVAFSEYGSGTHFMPVLHYLLSNTFQLSFLTGSMLYMLLGYVAILLFYIFFLRNINYSTKIGPVELFPLLFFLPNLHFWSAGIGKDTLLFFSISMFVFGMQKPSQHYFKIAIALVLSYLVRPHITIFLIVAFGLGYLFESRLKLYKKVFIFGIFLVGFILLFENVMSFLRIETLTTESLKNFSETKISNLGGEAVGSSVDISQYPFPLKVFTFLFRPLFFDINGGLAIVASFENLILLILTIRFIAMNPIKLFIKGTFLYKSLFLFVAIGVISFSLILGNLGIMLRQKNMFIPALLFLFLWAFSYKTETKLRHNQNQSALEKE